jgi:hypothetical protein
MDVFITSRLVLVKPGPDRDVGAPGRLIIWHFFLKNVFNIYLVGVGRNNSPINIYILPVM